MTHPKRPLFTSGGGGTPLSTSSASSSMKKTKPHPAAAFFAPDSEKNGLHGRRIAGDYDDAMLFDQDSGRTPPAAAIATTGVGSNLSRKKATPLQSSAKQSLVIKMKKGNPTIPSNFEDNTWATLKSAITAIFMKKPDPCDSEHLFRAVSNLCLHKMAGKLYERIEKECEAHISTILQSLVCQSPDLVVFLSLIEKCWQDFCNQMLIIRGIALVLDKTYVSQNPNVRSMWDMGSQLFQKHPSLSPEVEHKIITGLLRLVERERMVD